MLLSAQISWCSLGRDTSFTQQIQFVFPSWPSAWAPAGGCRRGYTAASQTSWAPPQSAGCATSPSHIDTWQMKTWSPLILGADTNSLSDRRCSRALRGHLVCFLPFSSCCATEAHFSASCRTRRRRRSRSLSGNSLDSDSVRRERNMGRPEARQQVHRSLTLNMRHTSSNGRFGPFRPSFIDVYLSSFPVWPPESRWRGRPNHRTARLVASRRSSLGTGRPSCTCSCTSKQNSDLFAGNKTYESTSGGEQKNRNLPHSFDLSFLCPCITNCDWSS